MRLAMDGSRFRRLTKGERRGWDKAQSVKPPERRASMSKARQQDSPFPFAAADVAAELVRWLTHLGSERRMSVLTGEAYRGDVGRFLAFLAGHLGGPPSLAALARLEVRDVRAFMAARRAEGV